MVGLNIYTNLSGRKLNTLFSDVCCGVHSTHVRLFCTQIKIKQKNPFKLITWMELLMFRGYAAKYELSMAHRKHFINIRGSDIFFLVSCLYEVNRKLNPLHVLHLLIFFRPSETLLTTNAA